MAIPLQKWSILARASFIPALSALASWTDDLANVSVHQSAPISLTCALARVFQTLSSGGLYSAGTHLSAPADSGVVCCRDLLLVTSLEVDLPLICRLIDEWKPILGLTFTIPQREKSVMRYGGEMMRSRLVLAQSLSTSTGEFCTSP